MYRGGLGMLLNNQVNCLIVQNLNSADRDYNYASLHLILRPATTLCLLTMSQAMFTL